MTLKSDENIKLHFKASFSEADIQKKLEQA